MKTEAIELLIEKCDWQDEALTELTALTDRIAELEACVRGLTNPLWRKTDFCDSGPHMRCIFCGAIRNYIEGIIEQYFCTNPACPAVKARKLVEVTRPYTWPACQFDAVTCEPETCKYAECEFNRKVQEVTPDETTG